MKYWFLLCLAIGAQAQVTFKPSVKKQSSQEARITKIEITDTQTAVYMTFKKGKNQGGIQYNFPRGNGIFTPRTGSSTSHISIDPKSYIYDPATKKKYEFLSAKNIPILPNQQSISEDETYKFSLYFKKLEPGAEVIDLIEGKNDPNSTLENWNFYEIKINNPEEVKEIHLTGKIWDKASQKPINGAVAIYTENFNERLDSAHAKNGNYSVKTEAGTFSLRASAAGYKTQEIDFEIEQKSEGNVVKDFYLEKIIAPEISSPEISTYKTAKTGTVITASKIYYETGKSDLKPESYIELDQLAEAMHENPKLKIRIEGHTDNVGDPKLNMELSIDRVSEVRKYLVNKGIDGKRVAIKGFGDTKPINKNGNTEERQVNRRVEIVVLES